MKIKYIFLILILLIIVFIIFISCPIKDDEPVNNDTNIETCADPDFSWTKHNPNIIKFTTQDECYLGGMSGHYFWAWGDRNDNTADLTVDLVKISGDLTAGYGIIFCLQDNNNFLCLLIGNKDTTGVYLFGKVQERQFKSISYDAVNDTPWIESADILAGHNQINKIGIKYTGSKTFEMTINSSSPTVLTLGADCDFTSGKYGYMVTSSPYENFPDEPVEIDFYQIKPGDIELPGYIKTPMLDDLQKIQQHGLKYDSDFLEIK